MDQITISFNYPINVSLQKNVNDIVYFSKPNGTVYKIGKCIDITNNSITCEIPASYDRPTSSDFVFFVKDTEANTSGIIGYYANVEFEITSGDRVELFAVNSEVFISS